MFRKTLWLSLVAVMLTSAVFAEQPFIIRPNDISDVTYSRNGTVFVKFTPAKAKGFAQLPQTSQAIVLNVPHPGLSGAQFRFDSIAFVFAHYSDAVRFTNRADAGFDTEARFSVGSFAGV